MRLVLATLYFSGSVVAALAADNVVLIGKQGKVDTTFMGCKTKDNITKIKSLVRANDGEAAMKYAISKIPDCKPIAKGTVGLVEDSSVWSGDSCIRPKGEPECYWLPRVFVVAP